MTQTTAPQPNGPSLDDFKHLLVEHRAVALVMQSLLHALVRSGHAPAVRGAFDLAEMTLESAMMLKVDEQLAWTHAPLMRTLENMRETTIPSAKPEAAKAGVGG